jgi:peptidoglycan lytic transglycosylase G
VGLVVLGAVLWFVAEAYPIGGSGRPAIFEVTAGEPFSQVADTLAAKGIIGSTLAFRLDLLVAGTPTVQPGWYELPTSSSFPAVRSVLANGPNASAIVVTTAESSREVALNLANVESPAYAQQFLSLVRNGGVRSPFQPTPRTSLEGLLAPGTYVLVPHELPQTLVTEMAGRFPARAASVGLTPTTRRHGLDAYQLITVASIVEKEGYLARNMPKTATVVFNRLARGMPLQMDATVEYAIGQDGGPVTHATESIPSPYNTYLHAGLTPTPICIPSTQALDATLHPPSGPWLFFTLVDRSGTLAFSTTFAQQLANEALAASRGI